VAVVVLADESRFDEIERSHPHGMSVQEIVDACIAAGEKLSEATFRKYVQLGLLPRSVRVGKKGKQRGSQGLYPASTVRQVLAIRRLMAQGFTIDEIQSRILFARSELDGLGAQLERALGQLERAREGSDALLEKELAEARKSGQALLDRLHAIERRLTARARMERAAV
jgi:DNA-binding transcriptional MerR regulator